MSSGHGRNRGSERLAHESDPERLRLLRNATRLWAKACGVYDGRGVCPCFDDADGRSAGSDLADQSRLTSRMSSTSPSMIILSKLLMKSSVKRICELV